MWYGIVGLAGPLIGLVLLVGAVHMIWRAVTLPRGTRSAGACERCKYDVAELATFTCPECGADLRRVGIITPAMEARRRGSMAGAILAWTFLCGLLAYAGVMAVFMFGFSASVATSTVSDWEQTLTPNSGAYRQLVVGYQSDGVSIASTIALEITLGDGATHPLTLDPGPMKVSGLGTGFAGWGPGTIEAWFGQIGLDTTDPVIAAEAAEVENFVDLLVMSPSSAFNPNLTHHQVQLNFAGGISEVTESAISSGVIALCVLGGLAIVYVVGLLLIVRRRRRLMRGVAGA
jgi:hypothetical protein